MEGGITFLCGWIIDESLISPDEYQRFSCSVLNMMNSSCEIYFSYVLMIKTSPSIVFKYPGGAGLVFLICLSFKCPYLSTLRDNFARYRHLCWLLHFQD